MPCRRKCRQSGESEDVRQTHKGDGYSSLLVSRRRDSFFFFFFLRTLLIFSTLLFTYPNDKFKENQAQSHISLLFKLCIPAAAIPTWPCLILRFHVRKFICLLPTPTLSNIVHVKGSILTSLLLPTFFRNEGGTAIC